MTDTFLSPLTEPELTALEQIDVRLTSRLMVAILKATTGALRSYTAAHGSALHGSGYGSAAKRVTKAMWVLLKTHPDCRVLVGQFPDQVAERLARCEVECEKRSAMIATLRAERAKLMEGLDEEPEPDEDEDLILGEPAPEVKGTP